MSEKDTKSKRNFSTKFLILAVVFALAAGLLAGTSGSNLIVEAASRVGLKIPVMASDSPDFSDARSIYYMLKSKYNGDISNEKLKAYLNKGVAAAAEDPYLNPRYLYLIYILLSIQVFPHNHSHPLVRFFSHLQV